MGVLLYLAMNPPPLDCWDIHGGEIGKARGMAIEKKIELLESLNGKVCPSMPSVRACTNRCGDKKWWDANSEDESSKTVSTSSGNALLVLISTLYVEVRTNVNGLSSLNVLRNLSGKRMKTLGPKDEIDNSKVEKETTLGSGSKPADQNSKPSEPPNDYIHVRATRGQATDSHNLAERARREKSVRG